jgi:hypothetical protein
VKAPLVPAGGVPLRVPFWKLSQERPLESKLMPSADPVMTTLKALGMPATKVALGVTN